MVWAKFHRFLTNILCWGLSLSDFSDMLVEDPCALLNKVLITMNEWLNLDNPTCFASVAYDFEFSISLMSEIPACSISHSRIQNWKSKFVDSKIYTNFKLKFHLIFKFHFHSKFNIIIQTKNRTVQGKIWLLIFAAVFILFLGQLVLGLSRLALQDRSFHPDEHYTEKQLNKQKLGKGARKFFRCLRKGLVALYFIRMVDHDDESPGRRKKVF